MYPQRPGRHQTVQDQNATAGHQLHLLPDGHPGQGRTARGHAGFQGRAEKDGGSGGAAEERGGKNTSALARETMGHLKL